MEAQIIDKLRDLLGSSGRIFITSHISPDPDALSSVLLLSGILKLNFPSKEIRTVLEEEPSGLEFLGGYDQMVFGSVAAELEKFRPDLFILLDGNNFERCSRHDGPAIREYLKRNQCAVAVIDHHEESGKDEAAVYINRMSPATVQDVYELCADDLKLKMPAGAAHLAMAGFYADTGGFVYVKAGQQTRVFGFAERLVGAGADIEAVKNQLESFSEEDMRVIAELAINVKNGGDYTYSFLGDDFITTWLEQGRKYPQLQRPTNEFLNEYIRNIAGRRWGFIVYKNILQGKDYYSASFRSQGGDPDVSLIAAVLGGGGHKPAAGAKFQAGSLQAAVEKIKTAIQSGSGS